MAVDPVTLVLAGGAAAVFGGRAVVRFLRYRSWAGSRLASAARNAGLSEIAESPIRWRKGPTLTGRAGPLEVYLEGQRTGRADPRTRIVIGLGPGTEELSLRRESLGSRLFDRLQPDVATGDPLFDRNVRVQGPAALALALLNAPARQRVADLLQGVVPNLKGVMVSASVEHGMLEVEVWDDAFDPQGARLGCVLKNALAVARHLTAPEDAVRLLAGNLRKEREAGVRLQRLLTLVREFPDRLETREALLTARKDGSDEVRLRAALALGDEGLATLRALIEDGESGKAGDAQAARAIATLGDLLPTARVKTLLAQALGAGRKETARACLAALGRPGSRIDSEELLLRALADTEAEVAKAAAQALGQLGTIDAVGPLREHASALLPSELRTAARQAVAEIQARLTGAEPGQLTLADGEAGALSLAGEAGGLSLSEDRPRRRRDPAGPVSDTAESDVRAGGARIEEG